MQGMFRANGGCGYVKKPDFLLNTGPDNESLCPKDKLSVKKILKVSDSIASISCNIFFNGLSNVFV